MGGGGLVIALYSLLISVHVVSLLFCAGPLLVLALGAQELPVSMSQRLMRVSSLGLVGLLVTGGAAVAMTGPAFIHTWWLRLSVLLFLVIGALTGRLRRLTRDPGSAGRVRTLAWVTTAVLVIVVYLMKAKPF
jgi:hypothetical protein